MEYSYEIGNSDEFISELMLLIAEKTPTFVLSIIDVI